MPNNPNFKTTPCCCPHSASNLVSAGHNLAFCHKCQQFLPVRVQEDYIAKFISPWVVLVKQKHRPVPEGKSFKE